MENQELLYEGKAKKVYRTDNPDAYIVSYKDDATAGNGAKRGTIRGKGAVNNRVTNHLMRLLERAGVPTHYLAQLSDRETLVKRVEIVPLEVIVRNVAAGSLAARLGLDEGTPLRCTVLEYCYKSDALGDPMVNEYHIAALGLATKEELDAIAALSLRVNEILRGCLREAGIDLIDCKLEFGRGPDGALLLADEISPDTCRFWDAKTRAHLDKDLFRRDLGGAEEAYREVQTRLLGE